MGTNPSLLAFLHGEVNSHDFHHLDHVRMAFEILRRHSFLEAAKVYSDALKGMAVRAGNGAAYHETITLAFLALIAERMTARNYKTFDAFAAENDDLFDKDVLRKWYAPARLASSMARTTFVLPEPRS